LFNRSFRPIYRPVIRNKINDQITAPELRVIDDSGQNLGVIKTGEALRLAQAKNLDLIVVTEAANPPVARIMSFDKFRYEEEKKEKKQRLVQKQKTKDLKTVQISPREADHDLAMKRQRAEKFLNEGHEVKFVLSLRGREKGKKGWAAERFSEFLKTITIACQITLPIREGGRGFIAQIIKK